QIRKSAEERKAALAYASAVEKKLADMEVRMKEVGNTGIEKAIKCELQDVLMYISTNTVVVSNEKKNLSEELEELRSSLEKTQKKKDELSKELEDVYHDRDEQKKVNQTVTKVLKDLQKAVEERGFDPD